MAAGWSMYGCVSGVSQNFACFSEPFWDYREHEWIVHHLYCLSDDAVYGSDIHCLQADGKDTETDPEHSDFGEGTAGAECCWEALIRVSYS